MKLISLNINYYPTLDEQLTNIIEQIIAEKKAMTLKHLFSKPLCTRESSEGQQ